MNAEEIERCNQLYAAHEEVIPQLSSNLFVKIFMELHEVINDETL